VIFVHSCCPSGAGIRESLPSESFFSGQHGFCADFLHRKPLCVLRQLHAPCPAASGGGIGGIIGNPRRSQRRSEDEYLGLLELLLEHRTDVLLMHDGPNSLIHSLRGSSRVREVIERLRPKLVVRGHAHWNLPLVELAGGVQVLNVDARVVVLQAKCG
jgi:hypothetical protein